MEHVTDQNYQEIVAKGLPLVLDFSATWCGPCKKVAPIMDEIAAEYEGKVIVGKCDVDECEDLAMQYGIRNVPTVLYIKDNNVITKQVGAANKSVFVEKLQNIYHTRIQYPELKNNKEDKSALGEINKTLKRVRSPYRFQNCLGRFLH